MPQSLSKVTSSKPLPQKSTVRVSKIENHFSQKLSYT